MGTAVAMACRVDKIHLAVGDLTRCERGPIAAAAAAYVNMATQRPA
jgi:hypothetical protein